jgi:hypothetical protein
LTAGNQILGEVAHVRFKIMEEPCNRGGLILKLTMPIVGTIDEQSV